MHASAGHLVQARGRAASPGLPDQPRGHLPSSVRRRFQDSYGSSAGSRA